MGDVYNWNAESPGFTDEEYAKMYANYESNLNIRSVVRLVNPYNHSLRVF